MATRFYLPSSGSAGASPAFAADWEGTGSASRLPMDTVTGATAQTAFAFSSVGSNGQALCAQFVSEPLAAQTISGTVAGLIRALQDFGSTTANTAILVRVVSSDGSTVRGTLLAMTTSSGDNFENDPEFPLSTPEAREFPNGGTVSLTSVSASDGDRIVVEVGATTATSGRTCTLYFGDDAASDLAAVDDTAANNPWVEFSADLTFQGAGGTVTTLTADSGTFALTGSDASLEYTQVVDGDPGAFTLTGTAANLEHHRLLTAESVGFDLTGTDATLTVVTALTLDAEAGTFSLTGSDADLFYTSVVLGTPGAFTLSGTDANLEVHRVLSADAASFDLTGTDAELTVTEPGSFSLSADPASFELSGTDADLLFDRALSADGMAVTLSGTAASLEYARVLTAEAGTFTLTGFAAALDFSGAVPIRATSVGSEAYWKATVGSEPYWKATTDTEG